jgi:hypothetical protein
MARIESSVSALLFGDCALNERELDFVRIVYRDRQHQVTLRATGERDLRLLNVDVLTMPIKAYFTCKSQTT